MDTPDFRVKFYSMRRSFKLLAIFFIVEGVIFASLLIASVQSEHRAKVETIRCRLDRASDSLDRIEDKLKDIDDNRQACKGTTSPCLVWSTTTGSIKMGTIWTAEYANVVYLKQGCEAFGRGLEVCSSKLENGNLLVTVDVLSKEEEEETK